MNLTALEYFREIVETKSISKVASNRHISQSALSQNIQKLEDELGHTLLERSNRGVMPTAAGRIAFKFSGTVLRVMEKMQEELEGLSNSEDSIRINGYLSLVDYSLPCVLYKIKKAYPTYNFEMRTRSNMDSINDLINDITDLSFITEVPCDESLIYERIGAERMVLVAHAEARIPDAIDVADLCKYEMVLMDDDALKVSAFLKEKLKGSSSAFEQLQILFKVDTIPAAKSSINNHLGMCFLPYMSVKKELYEKRYKIIEVREFDFTYDIYLVSRGKKDRSQAVGDVFDYFVKHGEREFC